MHEAGIEPDWVIGTKNDAASGRVLSWPEMSVSTKMEPEKAPPAALDAMTGMSMEAPAVSVAGSAGLTVPSENTVPLALVTVTPCTCT